MTINQPHNIGDRVFVGGGRLGAKVEGTIVGVDDGDGWRGRHYDVRVEKTLRDASVETRVGDIYRARYDTVFTA
jgi:hypothetical protein